MAGAMSSSRSAEAPAPAPANVGFSADDDAVDRRFKERPDSKSRDEELPAGEICPHCRSRLRSDERTGKEEAEVEKGSTSSQWSGPPPPFEAFLLPGTKYHVLRAGWGTKMPYQRDSSVDQETYSKLFDNNGYLVSYNNEKSTASSSESEAGEEGSEESDDSGDSDDSDDQRTETNEEAEQISEDDEAEQIREDDDPSEEVEKGIVKNCAIINFAGMKEKETAHFFYKLIRICERNGMEFCRTPARIEHLRPSLYTDVEKALWVLDFSLASSYYEPEVEGNPIGILIVILPESSSFHAKVEETLKSIGVVYQCFSAEDAKTPTKEALINASVEINEKVVQRMRKGVPRPIISRIPFVSEVPTIIFGADVSHPKPGEGSISVASVVATMFWPGVNKYKALVSHQPHTELVIKNLINNQEKENNGLVSELLNAFHKNTNEQVQRIIFFRNGAIKDQLDNTFCSEIKAIDEACIKLGMRHVTVTFVAVEQMPSHDAQGKGEMVNGSELDGRTVFDLSYNGSNSNEGIARYCVLHDENDFTTDNLRSLCINLLTPRIRWNYPELSIVPPAYFAQSAASRIRKHVEYYFGSEPDEFIVLPDADVMFP